MDRVFLDANVLVSAALTPDSRLRELWTRADVRLLGSPYVVAEARRNVEGEAAERLERLLARITPLPTEPADFSIPGDPAIEATDRPVLLAAIVAQAGWLLTGDATHFGHLYGQTFEGVTIARPRDYL